MGSGPAGRGRRAWPAPGSPPTMEVMPTLTDDEVRAALARLPGWERVGDEIVREYELGSFRAVIESVARIADVAEAANHHPDLDIRYRRLRVALTTHDEGGITGKDLALAAEIDAATH
jgi:4a-hydroxytetrahydrobiopterin dehydratase